ncbi:MAG: hypothetical protein KDJ74_12290 [Notoacmeibacter sp.]|nr:hypothetical protein [Notoacmeibacter sp.]
MNPDRKPQWAGRDMRLDPARLPQIASYASPDNSDVTFTVHATGVSVRKFLPKSRLPLSMVLPYRAFKGVAARAIEDESGHVTVTLELLHEDPALCVPLLVAGDLADIAADWRAWSDKVELPMLLFEADGVARALEESLGQVKTRPVQERRQGRMPRRHRPRFLMRRRSGDLNIRLVIDGEEIIARD